MNHLSINSSKGASNSDIHIIVPQDNSNNDVFDI